MAGETTVLCEGEEHMVYKWRIRKKTVLALRINNRFSRYVPANSRAMYLVPLNPAV